MFFAIVYFSKLPVVDFFIDVVLIMLFVAIQHDKLNTTIKPIETVSLIFLCAIMMIEVFHIFYKRQEKDECLKAPEKSLERSNDSKCQSLIPLLDFLPSGALIINEKS